MKDLNLFRCKDSVYLREVSSKDDLNDMAPIGHDSADPGCDGFLIRSNEKMARSIIASLRDKGFKGKVGIFGGDDAFNRRVIESLKIDYLVSVEALTKFDNLKQRDSGLNHVVAKMAATRNSVPSKLGTSGKVPSSSGKGVSIVVDFGDIASLCGKEKAMRIAKIIQNVKVCRKVGCSIKIASLVLDKDGVVDEKGRKAFGEMVGMSSSEIRDCVVF